MFDKTAGVSEVLARSPEERQFDKNRAKVHGEERGRSTDNWLKSRRREPQSIVEHDASRQPAEVCRELGGPTPRLRSGAPVDRCGWKVASQKRTATQGCQLR